MNPSKCTCRQHVRVLILSVLCGAFLMILPQRSRAGQQSSTPGNNKVTQYADSLSLAFEQAAAEIRPSLVRLRAIKHAAPAVRFDGNHELFNGQRGFHFDDRFLRQFFGKSPFPQESPPVQGIGSGVVVSDDGYILTNNHVVGDADELLVKLSDDREIRAKVVGTDPMSDLAVVRVDEADLKPARLGNSDQIKVGQWVVAAGCPFGLSDTITAGIVSAKGRSNVRVAEFEDFIQTDAAINPGNSGGPLVDLNGDVVGINTAIASRTGANNGIGFAIPINMARRIMDSLIHEGKVVRGWLGVAIQPLDRDLAESFAYHSKNGVLVGEVVRDSPGDSAGLKAGDIIVSVDGKPVNDVNSLRNLIAEAAPGKRVRLHLFRDGEYVNNTVKLGTLDKSYYEAARQDSGQQSSRRMDRLGMTVQNPVTEALENLGLPTDARGALVTEVETGGLAEMAGIQPGDLIVDIQGKPVHDARDFNRRLNNLQLETGIRLQIQSTEGRRFVLLKADGLRADQ